jgi:hypothetical protein
VEKRRAVNFSAGKKPLQLYGVSKNLHSVVTKIYDDDVAFR